MLRRLLTTAALAGGVVLATAAPASAHTIGGVQATNYKSEITSITPSVPGLEVIDRDLGRRIQVINHTGQDVMILGYQGEPYLKLGPSGVFENTRSPSLYQNKVTTGNAALVTLPPEADPSAPPNWHRRGGGDTVSWHDHRTRWEGADPPGVAANPGLIQTVVTRWTINLTAGSSQTAVVVVGKITWIPGPAATPWLAATIILFAVAFAAGATRWWSWLLSGLMAAFLAIDMVRLFGAATQGGGSVIGGLFKAVVFGVLEVAAWAGGIWAIGAIQQRRAVGLYAAMAVGVAIGFVSGVGDLLNLAYSQVPTSLPVDVARVAVAACIGLGFGLVGGCFLALRQLGPLLPTPLPARVTSTS